MDELERRWRNAFGRYAEIRDAHERQVARWEWASGERYDLRPFFFERYSLPRGRRLAAEPPERSGAYLYGFDAEDRMVLARAFIRTTDYSQPALLIALRGPRMVLQWRDRFLTHAEDRIESLTYTPFEPRKPAGVEILSSEDRRLLSYRSLEIPIGPQIGVHTAGEIWELMKRAGGVTRRHEEYGYEGNALVRARLEMNLGPGAPLLYEERLSYDAGRLVQVTRSLPDGTAQTVYQRVKKEDSLAELAKRVESRLLRAIPESLATAHVPGRVYCLALLYHDRYAPPDLVAGLERDRDAVLRRQGGEARYHIWVPAEAWVQVQDPPCEPEYSLFEQRIRTTDRGWETGRDMLRRVAGGLARRDWAGVLDVTPDFVAYAADYEADDIDQAIAASNEPGRVAELRAKGWL